VQAVASQPLRLLRLEAWPLDSIWVGGMP